MKPQQFERMMAARIISGSGNRFSRPIIRIAIGGIAIGMTVMILALTIMKGFKGEIQEKAIGFGAHIRVMNYNTTNTTLEPSPIVATPPLINSIKTTPGVHHVQKFGQKAGIMKVGDEILGVVLKGVGKDFDWSFFKANLKEGAIFTLPDTTTEQVLISRTIANKLRISTGKKIRMYFLHEQQQRMRVFYVSGIYETGMASFDEIYILGDMRHVQSLNGWNDDQFAGLEITLDQYQQADELTEYITGIIPAEMIAENVRESNPQIFSWLDVIDQNALIIIVLMLFVGIINMTSALIIIIIERTNMIGLLKTMGAADASVRRIFLWAAFRMIGMGILIGNVLGFGISLFQHYTGYFKLDQESYYVSEIPIRFDLLQLAGLNALCIVVCIIALIVPSLMVLKVTPVRAIRFS